MFEIPSAKRVRRDQLGDPSDDDAPNPTHSGGDSEYSRVKAKIRDQLSLDLSLSLSDENRVHHVPAEEAPSDDHQEFEFRLFSDARPKKNVVLQGDNELSDNEGHMARQRPRSYYIADPPDQEERIRLQHAALSGDEILKLSRRPNWGMQMPWRVMHVSIKPIAKLPLRTGSGSRSIDVDSRGGNLRKRPGKKTRIALRRRRRAREEKAAQVEKQQLEKEEHLREKRKRLNRLKKLRNRAKRKAGREGEADQDAAAPKNSSDAE